MSQIFLILTAIIGTLIISGVLFFLYLRSVGQRRSESAQRGAEQGMLLLQNQVAELTRAMDGRISEIYRHLRESGEKMNEATRQQFGESQRTLRESADQMVRHLTAVARGITESTEASKQVLSIAEQLQNLEKVLKHQKQRGTLGEASLELILGNILPPTAYKLQYQFKDGDMVDAVIMTKEGLIPVDAKFSLDNYVRLLEESNEARRGELERDFKNDLKRRIDETAKYIKPKENTLAFAFMFIPAEGIYYDLLINEVGAVKVNTRSLLDYAYRDKKVIIVSPTTFAAYLQSVLFGFRAFQIEKQAQEIIKNVEALSRHLLQYDDLFRKIGGSLSTTVNHYNSAGKELAKVDKDIFRITGEKGGVEPLLLEKPQLESEEAD